METKTKTKARLPKALKAVIVAACVLAVIAACAVTSMSWRSNPARIIHYETENPYIMEMEKTQISAHRSGGGIMPEETMMAFKNCAENDSFEIDVFEFDLHITKDGVLVLLHDDTLDRTSNSEAVFGVKNTRPEDYTYEELRKLNMGAKFVDENGNMPYADYAGDEIPDDIKILRIEDVLDYLSSMGDYDYIIEIKNGGELGKQGVDTLYRILSEKSLLDSVVFGTFKEEISLYVDDNHPDLLRSATIKEVLSFYYAALTNKKDFEPGYSVLQIPYGLPFTLAINLGTAQIINYAHSKNIAVQYWTINDEGDMEYLRSLGADCIMTDYPDRLYEISVK